METQQAAAPEPATPTGPDAPGAGRPDPSLWENCAEVDLPVTEREGRLPEGLRGVLLRNGPAKRDLGTYFWDGDGMVRALRFADGGQVRYHSRYIRTPKYLAERDARRPVVRSGGTQRPGGVLANAFRLPHSEANTHIVQHAGVLMALHEGGPPYRIDPQNLETLGVERFAGALPAWQPYSAHPHLDPETGELFNFGMVPGLRGASLRVSKLDPQGRMHPLGKVPLAGMTFMHDFVLSERWLIFCESPILLDMPSMVLGLKSVFDAFRWRPGRAGRVHFLSREGDRRLHIETEPLLFGHAIGARERGDEVQVDFVRGPRWSEVGRGLHDFREGMPFLRELCPWRMRFDLRAGRLRSSEQLDARPVDFPRSDERLPMHRARYSYLAANPDRDTPGLFRGTLKLDLDTGRSELFDFGPGFVTQEPVFVPKPGAEGEDTGWLLQYVHNDARRATDCAIFDARRVSDGPLCTLHLPVSAGMTFHGSWL